LAQFSLSVALDNYDHGFSPLSDLIHINPIVPLPLCGTKQPY
jgi:hypothetical protein